MNAPLHSGKAHAVLLHLGVLLLVSAPAAHAYPVALNLNGATAPAFTGWSFHQSQPGSMVVGTSDHSRLWALRLVDNGAPRNNAVVFNPPNGDAASRALRTIDVTFDFSMEDGNGGNGFSFNFANTTGLTLPGSLADQGMGAGLSMNFQADKDAPYGTCGRIQVEWQGQEKGTIVPGVDLGGACLWHNSFPNSWYRVRLTVNANGQMQVILSTVTTGGTVTVISTKSYTLDNWATAVNANWRFLFGARNADDNHRMRVYLDNISLSGDTAPVFGSVPSVTFNEDQPIPTFQFTAGDYETVNVSASAALTDSGGVLSGVAISGSPNTAFTVSSQLIPNASGTARIQLTISAGGLSSSREVVVTVNPVNDTPTLSGPGAVSTAEDTTGSVNFTATDPDNGALTVTALTSDNQSLIPNANLSVVGGNSISSGQSRTLQFTPAANASGTCNLTLQVSDGLASGVRTFQVTITAANDAPTFTSLPPVTMNEDTSVTASFTVDDTDTAAQSLTVEVLSSSDTALIPTGGVSLGGSGANRTVTLLAQPNRSGATTIQLRVSDGLAFTTANLAVTVVPLNDPPTAGAFVGANRALNFNGNGYVSAAVAGFANGNSAHTIESWIKPAALVAGQRSWALLLGQESTSGEHWLLHPAENNKAVIQFGAWSGTQVFGPALDVGVWQHIAATWESSNNTYVVYVNGVEVGRTQSEGTAPVSLQHFRLMLGWSPYGNNGAEANFRGQMDEVRVWNRALSFDEINRNRNYPVSGTESGLILYWRFDEGTGVVASDSATGASQGSRSDGAILSGVTYGEGPGDPLGDFGVKVVDEDNPAPVWLPGFDVEAQYGEPGATLTYVITQLPANGILSQASGNIYSASANPVIYTPNANYHGPDHFSYHVRDSSGLTTEPVTVRIRVTGLDDPPFVSAIPSFVIEENSTNTTLPFTVNDTETPPGLLPVSAVSSDNKLIPSQNLVLGGSGNNRTLSFGPAIDQIGTATITVTVSDGGGNQSRAVFQVRVLPKPAYALVDLGALAGRPQTFGSALNGNTWVAGLAQSQPSDPHAVVFKGLTSDGGFLDLDTLGGGTSGAAAINDANVIAGFITTSGDSKHKAAIWNGQNWTSLGTLPGGTFSEARGINNSGAVVGFSEITGGGVRAFSWVNGTMTQLELPAGATSTEATDMGDDGWIVGFARYPDGSERAVSWLGGVVTVHDVFAASARALGANNARVMAGYASSATGARTAFLKDVAAGTEAVDLGGLVNGNSTARAINDFGQVVGQSGTAPGSQRAFLRSAGRMKDLNQLIFDSRNADGTDFVFADSNWVLNDATGINNDGFVAGTGTKDGNPRAFLAVPAWVIGRPIAQPEGAVARWPEIELIQSQPGDNAQNSFAWSPAERRLYAIRPVTARLKWFTVPEGQDTTGTGTNLVVNSSRIVAIGISVWPKQPTRHIATVPVEVEPQGVTFGYAFQSVIYDTQRGVSVDPGTKRFSAVLPGYSVLHYLKVDTLAPTPNPLTQPFVFDVVKTVFWTDGLARRTVSVGEALTEPTHFDYGGKNGFVFFENAFYDGAGMDRAHDRQTRLGPILPVNTRTPAIARDTNRLVVVWSHTNRLGVAWNDTAIEYDTVWPIQAARIVIASARGSGELPVADYPDATIYNQADRTLPGYNPNEEHALLVGNRLFALRSDLNEVLGHSAAYALLKYREPVTREWRIKPYQVIPEGLADDGMSYTFIYPAEAGKEIAPPLPLSAMQLCPQSYGMPGQGPWWEDYKGTLYARAAGPSSGATNIVVRYFYPTQPGFWYDLNNNGTNDVPVGTCVAWLNRLPGRPVLPGHVEPEPVDITYHTTWPENVPVLEIGSSLLNARNGLPSVQSMARAEMIYDDFNPTWADNTDAAPQLTLARLYDPISARTVRMPSDWTWPKEIERVNVSGQEVFPQLPFALKTRLSFDPINKWLSFRGVLDEAFGAGANPLLMPNVISPREFERLKQLAPGNAGWAAVLTELYWRTRNPNGVDLSPADGQPDRDLRVGLTTRTNTGGRQVIFEPFGAGPKSLTAGLTNVPPAQPHPGTALTFLEGQSTEPVLFPAVSGNFTMEFWALPTATRTSTPEDTVGFNGNNGQRYAIAPRNGPLSYGDGHASAGVSVGINGLSVLEYGQAFPSTLVYDTPITDWTHVAVVYETNTARLYLNGRLVRIGQASRSTVHPSLGVGGPRGSFHGSLDELRIWNVPRTGSQIRNAMSKRLHGAEAGLIVYWRFDEGTGNRLTDASRSGLITAIDADPVLWVASTAPAGIPPRFITIAENNDASLPGLPVALHVIQVDDGPYTGDLKVLPGDNVFDQRVTVRHSGDFGAAPEQVAFEWYSKPDATDFDPTRLPETDPHTGLITDAHGWQPFQPSGDGINDFTMGDGGETGLLLLGDNWFICRYRGYAIGLRPASEWSDWVGEPGSFTQPRAQLVEGWIKRVIRGLNPFDARTSDFHAGAASTYSSMLVQAGHRYEGAIAFNPAADNLASIGLIEAYQTVLERGRSLSIAGAPPVDFAAANNALLLVSSKISDLYMLLGNEAYADAQDPTIGFGTSSGEYGTLAPSIFSFENQLDSLLEEELVLLRGRDDDNAGVRAAPVYNRLFWNFTLGEGEVAYQQTYNISDQNFDGFIDERDARILFPQGHGDAWGHYLTAVSSYYGLMRHPHFTWRPRTERVTVAGVAVEVDFLDERKFARAAAAKARAGREIVDLEYRAHYVEDPAGQWQGYKDTDSDRAWGVDEWARRVGQGAFFDWLAANALLPAVDSNPNHAGIQKIDRTTVAELNEIVAQYDTVQVKMDEADAGLNPLGLAKGALPFDIDPTFLEVGSTAQIGRRAVQGLTQFDQILERAVKALANAGTVWDQANKTTELLRRNQDSADAYARNVRDQEADYKGRMVELFGYPYAGDIGAGRTYPSGYDGPDLYHYMYVDATELTGENSPPNTNFVGYFTAPKAGLSKSDFWLGFDSTTLETSVLPVTFPFSAADYGFVAPAAWGQRRAPGELQMAMSDLVQANAQLKIALQNYDGLIQDIQAAIELLAAQYDVNSTKISVLNRQRNTMVGLNAALLAMRTAQVALNRVADSLQETKENLLEGTPKFAIFGFATGGDLTAPARAALSTTFTVVKAVAAIGSDTLEVAQNGVSLSKEIVGLQTELDLTVIDQRFEVLQRVKELEQLVRNEAALRLEAYHQAEVVTQAGGRYRAKLAEGERLISERLRSRRDTAADVTEARYQDMTFRIFRNDALQKYRAAFDLAARYVYLSANAYDYEVNFLGSDQRAGRRFLTDIVRQRNLGQLVDGSPAIGTPGLADSLARMEANWAVLKTRFGVINPQIADTRFSLREEMFRIQDGSDRRWQDELKKARVANLWDVPEFRRFCRPFAPEGAGPQPGLIIRFPTTITFGLNYFGWPLAGGDSNYDPSQFSTKIAKVGIWLSGSDGTQVSQTPRVYLVPIGMDVLRSPTGNSLDTREWRLVDQVIPVPFPIGQTDLRDPNWLPMNDSVGGSFAQVRRYAATPARHDVGIYAEADLTNDNRLIGRSAWNTEWMLIIPGGTLLSDPDAGLDAFINTVSDIKLYFQTYSYSGD